MLLRISVFLCITYMVGAERQLQVVTTPINGYTDQVNIAPFVKVGDKLYHFGLNKLSWFQAHLECGSLGGTLASIGDASEMAALSNFLASIYLQFRDSWWWLSGSDLHKEGNFSWYGNSKPLTFTDWSAGQPDNAGGSENCVHLWFQQTAYQMNDWDCKQLAYYICEAKTPQTFALTVF